MALKVGSTSVVDNARALQNIATVDATTAASISAAGVGGGGTYSFTASGSITGGDVVVLNNDGTVSVAEQSVTPNTAGTASQFESGDTALTSTCYDVSNDRIVVAYTDFGNSNYGTAVVGTVSGTSISFGTPVVFESAYTQWSSITYDATNEKVVVFYQDYGGSFRGTAIVGTVSGSSISFGSPVLMPDTGTTQYISSSYDSSVGKIVVSYSNNSSGSYRGRACVGTVSGTSISFGSSVQFESGVPKFITSCYDSNANATVIAYEDDSTGDYGTAVVGTVSGTSISFGTPVVFHSVNTQYHSITYDSVSQKVVIAYQDRTSTDFGQAVVGTVSGTSISFGSPVSFDTGSVAYVAATYNPSANKTLISWTAGNTNSCVAGTVSGTSISFGTSFVFFPSLAVSWTSSAYDSASNRVVLSYGAPDNTGKATVVQMEETVTNADDWIGISTEAISDTATGSVTIRYGTNDQQTGLTIGSTYYVADDGSLTTTDTGRKIGKALATDTLLITEPNS